MGEIENALRRQADALGARRAAQHGDVHLTFEQLHAAALQAAALLDAQDHPRRMPIYIDTTDGNWCSSLVGFFGAIVGGRIPILAPNATAPMGPFARLAVGTTSGITTVLHPGEITALPGYVYHFANPLDIVMSSGSTGHPKAYLFDEAHFAHEAEVRSPRHELRALHFGIPFTTSTGAHAIVVRHLMAGVTSIHLREVGTLANLHAKLNEIRPFEVGTTPFALSPLLVEAGDAELRNALPRQLRVYAGPLSDTLAQRLQQALPKTRIVSIYGATEAANTTLTRTGAGSQFSLAPTDRRVGLWHRDEARWARSGEQGEILMASGVSIGPPLLIGEPASDSHLPAGWIATGDLGRIETDGRLIFLGRSSDIVIHRGDRRSALELEQRLEADGHSPAIVFALSQEHGEQLCVLLETSAPIDPDVLAALADTAQLDAIILMESLPRTPLGKVRRREAIAEVVARLTTGAISLAGTRIYDLRKPPADN